jgi:hypothetical protein
MQSSTSCTICRCNRWRGHRHYSLAGRAREPNNSLRRDTSRNAGAGVAFIAEVAISFALTTVLFTSITTHFRYTPYFVGALYAIYHARDTALRNEHESRADLWLGVCVATACPLGFRR